MPDGAMKPDDLDFYEYDEVCLECGGEGFVYDCQDEAGCPHPEEGCDLCMRRCDWCNGKGR